MLENDVIHGYHNHCKFCGTEVISFNIRTGLRTEIQCAECKRLHKNARHQRWRQAHPAAWRIIYARYHYKWGCDGEGI
jgi:hypothetical protein